MVLSGPPACPGPCSSWQLLEPKSSSVVAASFRWMFSQNKPRNPGTVWWMAVVLLSLELLFRPLDSLDLKIRGQHWGHWGSSVQLTLGLAQGPASGNVQHAIDGRGPTAQALHGGQQAFHLRSQWNTSFEQKNLRSVCYTIFELPMGQWVYKIVI